MMSGQTKKKETRHLVHVESMRMMAESEIKLAGGMFNEIGRKGFVARYAKPH